MPAATLPTTVTTASRLRARGWTESAIRAQIAARRWQRCGHAIVVHNACLSRPERWLVARAHCGRMGLLTAFTALEAVGLRGWERDAAHVVLGVHEHVSSRCPVPLRPHRVRDVDRLRRLPGGPVQVPHQAAVIAAASVDSPRAAAGLVAAVVQQRVSTAGAIRTALEPSTRTRHRRVLLQTLGDIAQGADALSEIDFVRLCRRFGLPAPLQQAVRVGRDGRRRYLDAAWRRPDGRILAAEVDGAVHLDQRRWWADQERQNQLALADTIVLRFPSVVVRTEPGRVAAQLRAGLLM